MPMPKFGDRKIWAVEIRKKPCGIYAASKAKATEYAELVGGTVKYAGNVSYDDFEEKMLRTAGILNDLARKGSIEVSCQHNIMINCVLPDGRKQEVKNCERCVWGPNCESIKQERIERLKGGAKHARA